MKPVLSIVIPAKNEQERLGNTLDKYCKHVINHFDPELVEIIVVVNNSKDSTADIVTYFSQKFNFVKKIDTTYATGKGGAVALGFSEASGEYVGYIDADGSVSPANFFKLSKFLLESPKIDAVIGTRNLNSHNVSLIRLLIIKLYNLYVKFLFSIDYVDTQCSAKIFKASCAKELAKKLSSLGWIFDVNLLLLCKYLNFRVVEAPITWGEKEGSKFSLFEALFHLPFEFLSLKKLEILHYVKEIVPFDAFFPKKDSFNDIGHKKNIMIFMWRDIKHPEHGGSEIYTFEVARRLAKTHNVLWFTARPKNFSSKDMIDGVKIFRKGGLFTVYFWAMFYYVFKFRKHVDFVIDTENGMSFFTPLYVRKPIIFIVHHIHGIMWFKEFFPPISIIGFLLERVAMPLVYRKVPIITVSPSSKEEIKELGFAEKKIFLAYNAISRHEFSLQSRKSIVPMFLYHGRLKHYKQVDVAIKTFASLLPEFPNATLTISGVGNAFDDLVNLAKKLHIEDKVTFLGYVSDETKWKLMHEAWVFLMPSAIEGWGITVIEAAACGTPTVGFNVPGIRDSIKNDVTGKLCSSFDEYVSNTRLVVQNAQLRQYMSKNCKYWASLFSWEATFQIVSDVLFKITTKQSLLSDKTYPWNLEMRPDFVSSIVPN